MHIDMQNQQKQLNPKKDNNIEALANTALEHHYEDDTRSYHKNVKNGNCVFARINIRDLSTNIRM